MGLLVGKWGQTVLLSEPELVQPRGIPSTTGHRVSAREIKLKAANPLQGLINWRLNTLSITLRYLWVSPLFLNLGWLLPSLQTEQNSAFSTLLSLERLFQRNFGVFLSRKWDDIC